MNIFSLLLLTSNKPIQIGKCSLRGTCTPGWELPPETFRPYERSPSFNANWISISSPVVLSLFAKGSQIQSYDFSRETY